VGAAPAWNGSGIQDYADAKTVVIEANPCPQPQTRKFLPGKPLF
jgi:hypothetical protein